MCRLWQVPVAVLDACRHDLRKRELNVLLVLVLVRDQNQLSQEQESGLTLVDGTVLNADVEETLGHIQDVDVRETLSCRFADLDEVVQDAVDLVD